MTTRHRKAGFEFFLCPSAAQGAAAGLLPRQKGLRVGWAKREAAEGRFGSRNMVYVNQFRPSLLHLANRSEGQPFDAFAVRPDFVQSDGLASGAAGSEAEPP